jgi:hypothetical protein
VRTEPESRAEIHVCPNCFLFLEADTEIVYREAEGQVTVEMIKGSTIAILDPDPGTREPAVLTVVFDKTEHRISEKGNYRVAAYANANNVTTAANLTRTARACTNSLLLTNWN